MATPMLYLSCGCVITQSNMLSNRKCYILVTAVALVLQSICVRLQPTYDRGNWFKNSSALELDSNANSRAMNSTGTVCL